MSKYEYPDAWKAVTEKTYMDNIVDSVTNVKDSKSLTKEIDQMLSVKGIHG